MSGTGYRLHPSSANFVKFLMYNKCANPFYFLAETFTPAFLELVITLYLFGIKDVIRWGSRRTFETYPYRIETSRTLVMARGSRRLKHSVRPRLYVNRRIKPSYWHKALGKALWITQPLENLGFAILLYYATDKFFYDWHTLLEEVNYCTELPEAGPIQRHNENFAATFSPGSNPVTLPTLVQNRAGWSSTSFGVRVPPGTYHVTLAVRARSQGAFLDGAEVQVRGLGTLSAFYPIRSGPVRLNNQHGSDIIASGTIRVVGVASTEIIWEFFKESGSGLGTIEKADVFVTRQNFPT